MGSETWCCATVTALVVLCKSFVFPLNVFQMLMYFLSDPPHKGDSLPSNFSSSSLASAANAVSSAFTAVAPEASEDLQELLTKAVECLRLTTPELDGIKRLGGTPSGHRGSGAVEGGWEACSASLGGGVKVGLMGGVGRWRGFRGSRDREGI